MGSGIRAEVTVDPAGTCPITGATSETGVSTLSISRCSATGEDDRITEEFDGLFELVDGEPAPS